MGMLDQLLVVSALTMVVLLVVGNLRPVGWIATLLYALQLALLLRMGALGYDGTLIEVSAWKPSVFGQVLEWRYGALAWFFALITLGAAFFSAWFAAGEWGDRYREQGGNPRLFHVALALNVCAMLILIGSGDLLSLFVGWELVSWASFLLMALAGGKATRAAMRYLTYAFAGAMAVLAGLALVYARVGSLGFEAVAAAIPSFSTPAIVAVVILFTAGFGVKMALLPFHLWQAPAYTWTPGPGSAFLGAISARMGLFAMIVVLVQLVGMARLKGLEVPYTFIDASTLIAWVAALTLILPTYVAMRQNDARMLLAWHGIGQGGYMLLGVMVADELGSAGGLMHIFNYATYQAALFLVVTAVIHRTGTADLNRLGGLVARMPISFFVMLIGIIGLAGLPPMNGFVSKWLIYRSLVEQGMPLLFVASVIGTLGTILSVYKLIHNMFLGQLRLEHEEVKEAPWSMLLPMIILCLIVFATGYMPGIVLDWVAAVQVELGLPAVAHHLGGVTHGKDGLDMIWVVSVLLVGFAIGFAIFLLGGRSQRVHQLDNYAGGHFLTADTRYQYSDNFYAGLMRHIGPWYRGSFVWAESALISMTGTLAIASRGLFLYFQPTVYILVTAVVLLAWVIL